MDFQTEKEVVLGFYKALENAAQNESSAIFEHYCSANWLWRGVHPFDVQMGPDAVNTIFWSGFTHAFSSLQRRMDVFMAGENSLSDTREIWVTSMGHFMGLFDNPWLGIKPTHKLVMLRYAEFHRVEAGKIVETALFLDIPAVMMQVGLRPFPDQTAAQFVQPGPLPHDGIMTVSQPASEGAKTLEAINRMISDLGQWKLGLPLEEELSRSWHTDMVWWGPAGIGATYTIERYAKQHSGPFRASFTERSGTGHICRFAEGHYGGFFGWPNFTAKPTGGFLGMPASHTAGEFRVVDIYRRRDDKLIENWVFIDLLHYLKTQGLDVLRRLKS